MDTNDQDNPLTEAERLIVQPVKTKKHYSQIPYEVRKQFIEKVIQRDVTIKEAARLYNIKFSTAKAILQIFKRERRIGKKPNRQRKARRGSSSERLDLPTYTPVQPSRRIVQAVIREIPSKIPLDPETEHVCDELKKQIDATIQKCFSESFFARDSFLRREVSLTQNLQSPRKDSMSGLPLTRDTATLGGITDPIEMDFTLSRPSPAMPGLLSLSIPNMSGAGEMLLPPAPGPSLPSKSESQLRGKAEENLKGLRRLASGKSIGQAGVFGEDELVQFQRISRLFVDYPNPFSLRQAQHYLKQNQPNYETLLTSIAARSAQAPVARAKVTESDLEANYEKYFHIQ